jgi:hypothetical protein
MALCEAKTKSGKGCSRQGKVDYDGYCKTHFAALQPNEALQLSSPE